MYKTLCAVALLLGTLALSGSQSAAIPAASPSSPPIIARVKLTNQTAAIPTTTIFTPAQTGLYRASLYMTQTTAVPTSNGVWFFEIVWTDDAGTESAAPISVNVNQVPPNAWGNYGYTNGGTLLVFEAKAGQPVTYTVPFGGTGDGGAYSLYFTVERLE